MSFQRTCPNCGKEFTSRDKTRVRYCSAECYWDSRRLKQGPEYLRKCSGCGKDFPATVEYFSKKKRGLNEFCKSCDSAKAKAYYDAHKQERANAHRQYYQDNHDTVQNYKNQWQKEHIQSVRESNKKYREKTRDKKALWYKNNRQKVRQYKQKRKALKRNLPATFTHTDWLNALDWWDNRCAYCGRPQGLWHTLAQDHFVPLSKNGGYTPDNIVPACHGIGGCNNEKANRNAQEWLTEKFGKHKAHKILARIAEYFAHTATSRAKV